METKKRERCSYYWERRPAGRRYVTARGQCGRNATAECGRCSEHCNGSDTWDTDCSHESRRKH